MGDIGLQTKLELINTATKTGAKVLIVFFISLDLLHATFWQTYCCKKTFLKFDQTSLLLISHLVEGMCCLYSLLIVYYNTASTMKDLIRNVC